MNLTNGHMINDGSLIKGIASGSPEAMETFMEEYLPMASRVSYRILCDIKESEDVTREVFMKVWSEAGKYDFRQSVSVWMYRMICDLCRSHLLRLRLLELLTFHPSVYETSAPHPLSPEEDFITKKTWEVYCRASRFLTAKQRTVFVLKELEELSTEDVSAIMGMRSDHIRSNLVEAREKIKEELAKYGEVI